MIFQHIKGSRKRKKYHIRQRRGQRPEGRKHKGGVSRRAEDVYLGDTVAGLINTLAIKIREKTIHTQDSCKVPDTGRVADLEREGGELRMTAIKKCKRRQHAGNKSGLELADQ